MISWRTILIVWILAAIAAGATLWLYRTWPANTAEARVGPEPMLPPGALPVDEVSRVTVTRAGESPMVFERKNGEWLQTQPFEWPMQAYSIRQIAATAAGLEVSRRTSMHALGDDVSPKSLGLDPPQATVRLEWPGDALDLALGRPSVAGRGYVRLGDDVLLVGRALHDRVLDTDPHEWRSRDLFRGVSVEADRVEISSGGTRIVLVRERRRWRMVEPVATRVDPVSLEMLIQAVAGSQCAGFIADQAADLDRYGLKQPAGRIAVAMAASGTQALLVGSVIAMGSTDRFGMLEGRPVIVKLPQQALGALFPPPTSLIEATASGVRAADVKAIVVDQPDGELRIERDLDRWVAPAHDNAVVATKLVDELLNQLTAARATEVALQAFPENLRVATITFVGFDGRPLDTVRIAHDTTGRKFGFENGDNVLRVFPDSIALRLNPADYGLTK